MTSKAERIRTLLDEGILSTQEIADKIGVMDSYVRAVKQRRNPDSWCNTARRTGDIKKARRAGRKAYRQARHDGRSPEGVYVTAWRKELHKTGSKTATR